MHRIKVEDSLWTINKGERTEVHINLEKTKEVMWKSVFEVKMEREEEREGGRKREKRERGKEGGEERKGREEGEEEGGRERGRKERKGRRK